jgi:hypothetical protein
MSTTTNSLLLDALMRKESYRKSAHNLSWEDKVASIERMQEASFQAKKCMRELQSRCKASNLPGKSK